MSSDAPAPVRVGSDSGDDVTQPAFEVSNEPDHHRFVLRRDGEIVAHATYHRDGTTITVPHVETAPQHRGNGYAARLVEGMLAELRARDERIVPLCWFAADHIRSNPKHHDLLA